MIQEKTILADTVYQTATGTTNLTVQVKRAIDTPNIVACKLNMTLNKFNVNSREVKPGELCIVLKNGLKDIDFEINNDGDIIIHAEDAENYSLNSEGNLIYTYR